MQTFPSTFQFQPHPQAVPWPSKKRTLGGEEGEETVEVNQPQAPPVVRDNAEINGKKQRIASFFEDTDYSSELKASRDAILGTDTAMDQEEDDDFDFDEDEASYVPRSTYEPTFTSQAPPAQPLQTQHLKSPASMSSLTSGSGRSAWESSMPGTPLDSPAVNGHFAQAQGNFPSNTTFQQHQQQLLHPHIQQPDLNNISHQPHHAPQPEADQPVLKPSLGMMEDDFPVRPEHPASHGDPADASFSSTVEAEPYLSWFYGS